MSERSFLEKLMSFKLSENNSIPEFTAFLIYFSFIYFTNGTLKFYISNVYWKNCSSTIDKHSWILFIVDFLTFELLIILYVTVLDNYKIHFLLFMLCFNLIWLKLIYSQRNRIVLIKNDPQLIECQASTNRLDDSIINLSVHAFRSLLFIITAVCILAMDFPIFLKNHGKQAYYGISLMDIGVGYFILSHSMRLIRNTSDRLDSSEPLFKKELKNMPRKLFNTAKKSSILFLIGLLRMLIFKFLGYGYSISDYGFQWNFFFTIFFVKLFACPFDIIIRKSAFRAQLVSLTIGVLYQYLLTSSNYSAYLLDYKMKRLTVVNQNKEDILGSIGYLSLYFAGESVCYRIKQISNNKADSDRTLVPKVAIRCTLNLFVISLIYWIFAELTRFYVDEISRRQCNMSFVFFVIATATFLWASICFIELVIVWFITKILSKTTDFENHKHIMDSVKLNTIIAECCELLENSFSFVKKVDSKMTGLFTFLLANIFAILVSFMVNPRSLNEVNSLLIISTNNLALRLVANFIMSCSFNLIFL